MKYFEFKYKRLGVMEIRVIAMADSLQEAMKDIKKETYGWSDYSIDNDEMLKIFDIDFLGEVSEESMLENQGEE